MSSLLTLPRPTIQIRPDRGIIDAVIKISDEYAAYQSAVLLDEGNLLATPEQAIFDQRLRLLARSGQSWEVLFLGNGFKEGRLYGKPGVNQFGFSRGSNGTRFNSSGNLVTEMANMPRMDYDPHGKWVNLGLLLEPARTNLFLHSEDFQNDAWNKSGGGAGSSAVITPNFGTIYGKSASKVVFPTNGGLVTDTSRLTQSISLTNGQVYKQHFLIKSLGGTQQVRLVFAGANITVNVNEIPQVISFTFTATSTATFTTGILQTGLQSQTSDGFLIAFGQLELGSYASSYIQTTNVTVTRLADIATLTDATKIGQTQGVLQVRVNTRIGRARDIYRVQLDTDNWMAIQKSSNDAFQFTGFKNGVQEWQITEATNNRAGTFLVQAAYAENDLALIVNDVVVGTASSGSIPACNQAIISQSGDRYQSIAHAKTRLSNASLQRLANLNIG